MTRQIAFLLLLSIFLNICPCYAEENNKQRTKDTPGTAIFVMAVPVEIQVEKRGSVQEDKKWNIQASYPAISGLKDKKAEKKINQLFQKHSQDLQKKLIKNAKLSKQNVKFELISQYSIKETISPYFLIVLFDYQYKGGAQGLSSYRYVTLDLQNNCILTLNQLFNEKDNYKESLQNLMIKQIEKRADAKQFFNDEIYANLQIQEDQNFYIKPCGDLVLVFNLHEVTPYTTGKIEFVFTQEELKRVGLPYEF